MDNNLIECVNISKSYNGDGQILPVFQSFSLIVKKGDFIAITGKNGVGKSTLLNILCGLIEIDNGKIVFDNNLFSEMGIKQKCKYRAENMGIIFQDKNLIDSFNVFDNLLLPFFIIKKKITTDVIMKIDNLMKRFDIFDLKNRSIDKLSGGQKQKVAIVRALVLNPIIIFADEPTGGLDKESETELMEIFKKINETDNTTILMVTHSDYCASYAKSIVKLEKDVL